MIQDKSKITNILDLEENQFGKSIIIYSVHRKGIKQAAKGQFKLFTWINENMLRQDNLECLCKRQYTTFHRIF